MAVLESDSLVADSSLFSPEDRVVAAGLFPPAMAEAFSPDKSWSEYPEVVDVLAPDKAIVPVIVAVVLICVPRGLGLGCVVGPAHITCGLVGEWRVGGKNRRTLLQEKRHKAFQADREARIDSGRKDDHSAPSGGGSFNRSVDGRRVDRLAIPRCPKPAHIEAEPERL